MKNIFALSTRIFTLCLLTCFITACDDEEGSSNPVTLTGTWVCIEEVGYVTTNGRKEEYAEYYEYNEDYMTFVFEEDGTLTWDGEPYTYKYRNNKIEVSGTDGNFTFSVVQMIPVNPPRMILDLKQKQGNNEVNMRYRYLKMEPGGGQGPCTEAPSEMSGLWNCVAAYTYIDDGYDYKSDSWEYEDDPTKSHSIFFNVNNSTVWYYSPYGDEEIIEYCYRDGTYNFSFRDPESGKQIKAEMYNYMRGDNEIEISINFRHASTYYYIELYYQKDGTGPEPGPGPGVEPPSEDAPALIFGNLWTCIHEEGYKIENNINTPISIDYKPGEGRWLTFYEEGQGFYIDNCSQYGGSRNYRYYNETFYITMYDPYTYEEKEQEIKLIYLDDTELILSIEYRQGDEITVITSTYTRPPKDLLGKWTCISSEGYEIENGVTQHFSNTYRLGEGDSPVFYENGSFGGTDDWGEPAYGKYYYYRGDLYMLAENSPIWYNTIVKETIRNLSPYRLVTENHTKMPGYENYAVSEYVKLSD